MRASSRPVATMARMSVSILVGNNTIKPPAEPTSACLPETQTSSCYIFPMTEPPPKTPDGILRFWLGPLRSAADASRENWRDRMLRWRVGVFARAAEDADFFDVQREWCEQIHRQGIDGFFSGPAWETPMGLLAKLIALDQFPRSVYRGTPAAYANDGITARIAERICDSEWDLTEYNVVERFWVYVALSHPEELALQELAVRKTMGWSDDLVAAVSSGRRKINQYIGWYFIKALIEHSDALVIFGRFPHRNAILGREHQAGEPRYLTDPVRPLWSYTQPPQPYYYAILGALYRIDGDLDEQSLSPAAVGQLQASAMLGSEGSDSLMDVFDLAGAAAVSYTTLYRHMLQRNKARAFDAVCATPVVRDLFQRIKALILEDPDEPWPPKSAKRSVRPVIDVRAMRAIVTARPSVPVQATEPKIAIPAHMTDALSLVVQNDSTELESIATEVDGFAKRHGFAEKPVFEIQLAIEEWVMNTINYGFNDAAEHEIGVHLQFDEDTRTLAVHIVDDAREFDPLTQAMEPDIEGFLADRVAGSGVGVQLVRRFADDIEYRRLGAYNHLTLTKSV